MSWIPLLISAAAIGVLTVSFANGQGAGMRPPVVPLAARPFDLADVRLLDGPFKLAQDLDEQWLLKIDADRLLSGYRSEAGLEPKAPRYGGWESRSIGGHSLGHYLSALSLMYAATGKQPLLDRVTYIVNELAECQRAHGDGYLSAIPNARPVFAEVARGQIRSKGFDLNGLWVPWYTQHKLMAGLRDAYLYCDNATARDVLVKLADWTLGITDHLTEDQLQQMLACEHGGMNEVAADVYAITADQKYLTLARRFHHKAILEPLAQGRDILPGKHANTQIPKLIGLARQYELTGRPSDRAAAEFFWRTVVEHHTYVNGGNSLNEHFGPPDVLAGRLNGNTAETCNVYNMLKLTAHLFAWTADPTCIEYYERALLNHILASQHRTTGQVLYYLPLKTGSKKQFQSLFDDWTCCVGTGMENHARYGESIYFRGPDDSTLYVNLFIASELKWRDKGIVIRQQTQFPESDDVKLVVAEVSQSIPLAIRLRHPRWAPGIEVRINGQQQTIDSSPGSFLTIRRTWNAGDTIELKLSMPLRSESPADDANKMSVFRGPVLLAGEISQDVDAALVPALLVHARPPQQWLVANDPSGLSWRSVGVGRPTDLSFRPLYQITDSRYGVYWDVFTAEQWAAREAEYRAELARQAEIERRTIDFFQPGEMQPERDHNFTGEKTRTGEHAGRKWRDCTDGGFFSFDMKTDPQQPVELVCTYWGSDGGDHSREFEILVDGQKLATQKLSRDHPDRFFDVVYPIPRELTAGKHKVSVRFTPISGKIAGGLYGCRTLRPLRPEKGMPGG